jgi:hypothetical protein
VQQFLAPVVAGGRGQVALLPCHSSDVNGGQLLSHLGAPARFVSIDGSHERDDVFWDLGLAEQVVGPGGVVALDDFINPVTLGVNEAANLFFATPRRLVPWAYIENKLFLCQEHWSHRYRQMLEAIVMRDEIERHSKVFRENNSAGRNLVEQRLWGSTLLIVN